MGERVQRRFCTDCGAEAQLTSAGWRCPWATNSSSGTAWSGGDLVTTCRSPYERTRETLTVVRDTKTVQR